MSDPSLNAFAIGLAPENAAVAVTTGLLERLDRQEVEAVLAHEVAHIRNYDVRLATTAVALVAIIALLSDMGRRLLWYGGARSRSQRDGQRHGNPIVYLLALVFVILGPTIAVLLQLALPRNREYLADASGAELCRNPNALASALRKISSIPEPLHAASETCASLYFTNPFKKNKRTLFSTHPPTEERIRRLEQMM